MEPNTIRYLMFYSPSSLRKVALLAWGLGGHGLWGSDEPGLVEIVGGTAATGTVRTAAKYDDSLSETPDGFFIDTITLDPVTITRVFVSTLLHPQSSFYTQYPYGHEPIMDRLGAQTSFHLRCTFSEAVTVDGIMEFED